MAVISSLRLEYASRNVEPWLRSRPRGASCVLALAAADGVGFLIAAAMASLVLEVVGVAFPALADVARSSHQQMAEMIDIGLLTGAILYLAGNAHYVRRMAFWSEFRQMLGVSVVALLTNGFITFLLQQHQPRLLVVMPWLLFPIAAMVLRSLVRHGLGKMGLWQMRALVVGTSATVDRARSALLSNPRLGYHVAASVQPAEFQSWLSDGRCGRLFRQQRADLIVLASDPDASGMRGMTEALVRERLPFAIVQCSDGLPVLGFEQTYFSSHNTVMFSYRDNLARPVMRGIKLGIDVVAALFLLVLLAPVLLAIAVAVKSDGGPVLFAHRRVGAGGREFGCLKFRSMVTDADAALRRLLEHDPAAAIEWAETQKLRNDPRVTWVGKLLRATSLDEIPQLFNVLRLDMSLVGPRPIVRAEVPRYGADIVYYYETRPGVTGLWQVSGRSDIGYVQRVHLDTWYVKNWTLWHDLVILAKTIPAVLQRRGAV